MSSWRRNSSSPASREEPRHRTVRTPRCLRARESAETFAAQARAHGRSVAVTVPSSAVRRLGIEVGDELEVTVRKAGGRDRGRGRNAETPPAVP